MSDNITLPREVVERVETLMKIANKWSDDVDILASTVVDLRDDLTVLRTALAAEQQEPVADEEAPRLWAWMREGWSADCGPWYEVIRNDQMTWRDRKGWTPLYTALAAEPTKQEAKQEPVAYFDLQKQVFYWARPTMIDVPMTIALEPLPLYAAPPTAAPESTHPGCIIGSHWLETAYSRVCAGEAEADVLRDCGWERVTDAEALRRDAERLTDEQIDSATSKERDQLLDHIYEYGTAAEGILERIRKLARAAIDAAMGEKR